MSDLLLESRRGMAIQKRLIGGGDLWKIKKIPAGLLRGWNGGFFIHTTSRQNYILLCESERSVGEFGGVLDLGLVDDDGDFDF